MVESKAPSWVQKQPCTISESRDITKSKLDIRFEIFWILDNLLSWNLMSHIVLLIFPVPYVVQKWVLIKKMLNNITFKMGCVPTFIPRKLSCGIRFQDVRLFIISNSWNLIPHIVLLESWLPDITQKSFCTPNGAMDLTFQMRHVPAF